MSNEITIYPNDIQNLEYSKTSEGKVWLKKLNDNKKYCLEVNNNVKSGYYYHYCVENLPGSSDYKKPYLKYDNIHYDFLKYLDLKVYQGCFDEEPYKHVLKNFLLNRQCYETFYSKKLTKYKRLHVTFCQHSIKEYIMLNDFINLHLDEIPDGTICADYNYLNVGLKIKDEKDFENFIKNDSKNNKKFPIIEYSISSSDDIGDGAWNFNKLIYYKHFINDSSIFFDEDHFKNDRAGGTGFFLRKTENESLGVIYDGLV
tara:strand:+ start:196 stop:969 length:774 start_codon:yes stop_codon:yes gene_type:complete